MVDSIPAIDYKSNIQICGFSAFYRKELSHPFFMEQECVLAHLYKNVVYLVWETLKG
jgi:hypothetical protein